MTAAVTRLLTTTDRANIDALYAVGVGVRLGPGLANSRTRPKLTIHGNTLPIREQLKNYGFVWSQRSRTWTAFGNFDLATLLPELIAAHHAHERRSEVAQAGITYAGAVGLVAAVRAL